MDWDDDDDTFYATCDCCKHRNLLIAIKPDPYLAEVEPDEPNPPSAWCIDCYNQRLEDV